MDFVCILALLLVPHVSSSICPGCCKEPAKVVVPGGHTLHVEVHGNCSGPPLLYFHGGWGPLHHDLDIVPSEFRIIYFHQRGWGLSTPQGSVINNSLTDVVNDAEVIRSFLGIEQPWVVFGGSNGAALALMYAARFPEVVVGVVLRGYWAITPGQVSWNYFGDGKRTLYPDEWDLLCQRVDCTGIDLLELYHSHLMGPAGDDGCRSNAPPEGCFFGCSWLRWDALGSAINHVPQDVCAKSSYQQDDLEWYQQHPMAAARLGVHFYRQKRNVPDLSRLLASPVTVHFVNGRLDLLCPPRFAAEMVAKARDAGVIWKHTIVEHAEHSGTDPGMTVALRNALGDMLTRNMDDSWLHIM